MRSIKIIMSTAFAMLSFIITHEIPTRGRLFGMRRACIELLNNALAGCNELTRVMTLSPESELPANAGVHVLSEQSGYPGLIPGPRRPGPMAFSGDNKNIRYVSRMGAVGLHGKLWATPEGIRNTAMTIHTPPMLTLGCAGRPR